MHAHAATGTPRILSGIRVVELTDFVAGPFAGKLLADLDANVIKLEPPRGDSARRRGPFADGIPQRETSSIFLQYNTNKRSVRLDRHTRAGRRLLDALLDQADVFLYDLTPREQAEARLRPDDVRDGRPALIVASLTPHGLSGPAADRPSAPLTRMHAAGAADVLVRGFGGEEGRPVATGGYVNEADAGMACAIATVAALIARGEAGEGQLVEVSMLEAISSLDRVELSIAHNDPAQNRMRGMGGFGGRFPCADGDVIVVMPQAHQWAAMVKAMGDPAWAFDDEGALKDRAEHGADLNPPFRDWCLTRTRDEIYRAGQAQGAPVGPVFRPSEVMASEQEAERGFFEPITHPLAGEYPYATFPALFGGTEIAPRRAAPLLGADTEALLGPLVEPAWTSVQARRAGVA